MDKDGYPTEEELATIRDWDLVNNDPLELVEYIRQRWQWADSGFFDLKGKNIIRLRLSTGGWSGNESIISALQPNLFWYMYWQTSRRGGHYWFRIDRRKWLEMRNKRREKKVKTQESCIDDKAREKAMQWLKKNIDSVPLPDMKTVSRDMITEIVARQKGHGT